MRPVQWIPAGVAVACIALGGFAVMRTRPPNPLRGRDVHRSHTQERLSLPSLTSPHQPRRP